jgi:branched-chain amino acid transport system ATP-binding protein
LDAQAVSEPLLAVEDVRLSFSGVRALAGVSLTLEEGETLGIIGPNGSGKSTLFNVVSGIYRPDGGVIRFHGETIGGRPAGEIVKRGIARTYQNKRLFASLTVLENVLVPSLHGEAGGLFGDVLGLSAAAAGYAAGMRRAKECLDFVGLGGQMQVVAGSLAYGQQNRLELARALALQPKLLMLDEPAAGLNPAERLDIRALVERIRGLGVTIAMVEHDMRVVAGLCSRVVVLDYGTVLAEGTPQEVAQNPRVIEAYFGTADGMGGHAA